MGPEVAVQWESSSQPSADARRSLAEWAEARGVHLALPRTTSFPIIRPDEQTVDRVEDELERARDAIAALDANGTERALAKAEALLHDHAELPEAAWLRAEVYRARAMQWRRLPPHDAVRSAAEWARAAALDGGRAAGVGEVATLVAAPAFVLAKLTFEPSLEGDVDRTRAMLDGTLVRDGELTAPAGEHQLTVTVDGALVWAAWVVLEQGAVVLANVPRPSACSIEDLKRAKFVQEAIVANGVRCTDWVFARQVPSLAGGLTLATCEADHCGAPFRWKVGALGPVLSQGRERPAQWPSWATWTIVGASVVGVAAASLAATGIFRPTRDEPLFTTGGLHASSAPLQLRFGQ